MMNDIAIQTDKPAKNSKITGRPKKYTSAEEAIEANRKRNYENYVKNKEKILARKKELKELKINKPNESA